MFTGLVDLTNFEKRSQFKKNTKILTISMEIKSSPLIINELL